MYVDVLCAVHCPRSADDPAFGSNMPHFRVIMRDHYQDPDQVSTELLSADDSDALQVAGEVLDPVAGVRVSLFM